MVQLNVAGIWLLAFPRRRKLVGMGSAPGWDKVRAIRGRPGPGMKTGILGDVGEPTSVSGTDLACGENKIGSREDSCAQI